MRGKAARFVTSMVSKFIPSIWKSDGSDGRIDSNYQSEFRSEQSLSSPLYQIASDRKLVDEVFESLRARIYDVIDEGRELQENGTLGFKVHREFGKIGGNRPYFYIRPFNHLGWLFERQGVGWVVSLADKVAVKDLFVRKGDVWDLVSILEGGEKGAHVRVSSQRLSMEHIALSVYVERLVDKIGLKPGPREY